MRWVKLRWFLAAGCLLASWALMSAALKMEGMDAAPHVIFSVLAFVNAVLLTAPETALRVAEWFGRLCSGIFFPSEEFSKPPLSYRLARRYRDEKRYEDAARQYRKIIRHYPDEADAYVELLDVARQMGDRDLAREYRIRFRRRFRQEPECAPTSDQGGRSGTSPPQEQQGGP